MRTARHMMDERLQREASQTRTLPYTQFEQRTAAYRVALERGELHDQDHDERDGGDTLTPREPELWGAAELCAALGVSRQTLSKWRRRPDFPAPLAELASGPVWDAAKIRAWARRTGRAE